MQIRIWTRRDSQASREKHYKIIRGKKRQTGKQKTEESEKEKEKEKTRKIKRRNRTRQEIGSDIGRNLYICTEEDRKFIHFALAMLGDRVSEIELRQCLLELAYRLMQASEFRPFPAMLNSCLHPSSCCGAGLIKSILHKKGQFTQETGLLL